MKIFATSVLHFWDCLANIIKNHIFASLTPTRTRPLVEGFNIIEHDIINEQGNCSEKK